MEHANLFMFILLPVLSFFVVANILRARRGSRFYIRRIAGIDAIDEAVGRATEMGRPLLFSIGLGGIDIVTLMAFEIIRHVSRLAARFRNRVIVPVVDPVAISVLEEIMRQAYTEEGHPDAFQVDDIRFLSGDQFAYAAGVVGIMHRDQVASNFFFGTFFAESLILSETGQHVGAIQIAGTPSTLQIPFFIATCDYVVIGEEYYATSAYLSREPTLVGSLVGQDWGKLLLMLIVLLGLISATLAATMDVENWFAQWVNFERDWWLQLSGQAVSGG